MNFTIAEAYELYYRFVAQKKKPQSLRSIDSRFQNYILSYFEEDRIRDINAQRYLEWQEWILKKGFSYKYKKALHYSCVALFNFLIKFYDVEKNIPSLVGNFANDSIVDDRIHVWNRRQFRKFIHRVNEYQYKVLFHFLFRTGVREGEALALNFKDVQLSFFRGSVSIYKTISKEFVNGARVITKPKTKTSIRVIRIDWYLRLLLFILRWRYKRYYIKKTQQCNDVNELFVFGAMKPLAPTTIARKKDVWCDRAKVKRIRIHDFRHSHATDLLSHHVPVTIVAERLGHADIAMTLNTYSHVLKRDEKRVLRTLSFLGW